MPFSLQVLYPVGDGLSFNFDYYMSTHMDIVSESIGQYMGSAHVAKGLAGGPDVPSPFFVVATLNFADKETLDAAMAKAGPAVDDIKNFYNGEPQMVIGEVLG